MASAIAVSGRSPQRIQTQVQAFWQRLRQRVRPASHSARTVANRDLALSATSLGLVAAGALSANPVLLVASVPPVLVVYLPAFRAAYAALRQDRRVTPALFDATRIAVCALFGFYGTGAINAVLFAVSQRWLLHSQEGFEASLADLLGIPAAEAVALVDLTEPDSLQQRGEISGTQAAPFTYAAFFLTIPFFGVNRAASFLCTSFGAQMRLLGPLTVRTQIAEAARHGLLIKQGRTLEDLNAVNMLVIDVNLLNDAVHRAQMPAVVAALRHHQADQGFLSRRLSIYALVPTVEGYETLICELGLDGVVENASTETGASPIDAWQRQGSVVCYVGDDEAMRHHVLVSVRVGKAADVQTDPSSVIVVHGGLASLPDLFACASRGVDQQRFNLHMPIALDAVDIATTVVLHFGLLYSTLFNYGGLLLGIATTRLHHQRSYRPAQATPGVRQGRLRRRPSWLVP